MKKQYFRRFPPGTPEFVIAHAVWQHRHGRNPSMQYKDIRNPKKAYRAALADLRTRVSSERIVVLEDDNLQMPWILQTLHKAFPTRFFELAENESDFYKLVPELAKNPPALIILDILVRWGNFRPTDPPEPEQVKKEGFFYAGFRCRDLVRTNPALNGVPILFYSLLEDIDVAHLLKPGDTFLSKSFRGEELVEVVEKLLNQKKAAAAAA